MDSTLNFETKKTLKLPPFLQQKPAKVPPILQQKTAKVPPILQQKHYYPQGSFSIPLV